MYYGNPLPITHCPMRARGRRMRRHWWGGVRFHVDRRAMGRRSQPPPIPGEPCAGAAGGWKKKSKSAGFCGRSLMRPIEPRRPLASAMRGSGACVGERIMPCSKRLFENRIRYRLSRRGRDAERKPFGSAHLLDGANLREAIVQPLPGQATPRERPVCERAGFGCTPRESVGADRLSKNEPCRDEALDVVALSERGPRSVPAITLRTPPLFSPWGGSGSKGVIIGWTRSD